MRRLLPILLLFAGCSKGPSSDLPAIVEARSLGAEWALVNQLALEGKLSGTFTQTMRANVRQELKSVASSLKEPRSSYAMEIEALLKQADDAPPARLRSIAGKLKQIENELESA